MAVTVRSDRRFRRRQVRPTRRRRLQGRAWWSVLRALLVLGALAYGGYRASELAVDGPWLRVQHIRVTGNERLSRGEVLGLLDGLMGEHILLTRLAMWRERVLASPWVADAALRRRLPSTIEVSIRERRPVGIARLRGELYLVDGTGTVVDEFGPRYAEFDLPIIDGLVTVPPEGEPEIDHARGEVVARVMASMRARPDLASRISQIDVSEPHDVKVILQGDPAVVRLGAERFAERLQSYIELAPTLRARVPAFDYVDLRYGERIYVGPSPAGGGGQTRAGAPGGARPRAQD